MQMDDTLDGSGAVVILDGDPEVGDFGLGEASCPCGVQAAEHLTSTRVSS